MFLIPYIFRFRGQMSFGNKIKMKLESRFCTSIGIHYLMKMESGMEKIPADSKIWMKQKFRQGLFIGRNQIGIKVVSRQGQNI